MNNPEWINDHCSVSGHVEFPCDICGKPVSTDGSNNFYLKDDAINGGKIIIFRHRYCEKQKSNIETDLQNL